MSSLTNSLRTIDHIKKQSIDKGNKYKKLLRKKLKRPKLSIPNQTQVKRYDQNGSFTILRIKFASSAQKKSDKQQKTQRIYIRTQGNQNYLQQSPKLPFIRYKDILSPKEQLKNKGYNPDTRTATELYQEKCEEKKKKFMNKMEVLKQQIRKQKLTQRKNQLIKSRIRVKILGQQLKRKRQKEFIKLQQKKGKKMLQSLIIHSSSDTGTYTTL